MSLPGEGYTKDVDSPEVRFSSERIEDMIDSLIQDSTIEVQGGKPFAVGIIDGTDPRSDVARLTEYSVFQETFGNSYELMEQEYTPYDDASTFIFVVDVENKRPFGSLRLIRDNPNGLKTINDVNDPKFPWGKDFIGLLQDHLESNPNLHAEDKVFDPSGAFDVGTLGVERSYRKDSFVRDTAKLAICRAALLYTEQQGLRDWIMVIDEDAMSNIQNTFDSPLEFIPGLDGASYLDSPVSYPMYLNMQLYRQRIAQERPDLVDFFDNGNELVANYSFKA